MLLYSKQAKKLLAYILTCLTICITSGVIAYLYFVYPMGAPLWAVEGHIWLTPKRQRPALVVRLVRTGMEIDFWEMQGLLDRLLDESTTTSKIKVEELLGALGESNAVLFDVATRAEGIEGDYREFLLLVSEYLGANPPTKSLYLEEMLYIISHANLDAQQQARLAERLLEYSEYRKYERTKIILCIEWFCSDRRTSWSKREMIDIEEALTKSFNHSNTEGRLSIFRTLIDFPKAPSEETRAFLMRIAGNESAPLWQRIYAVLPFLRHGPLHTDTETGEVCLDILRAAEAFPARIPKRPFARKSPLEEALARADDVARESLIRHVRSAGQCPDGIQSFTLAEWIALFEKKGIWPASDEAARPEAK